jgi:hypothetical protein
VAVAWQRLVASGGAARIGRITNDVGWSHKHLIAKFKQQIGLTPKTAPSWYASTGYGASSVPIRHRAGTASPPTPATRTRRISPVTSTASPERRQPSSSRAGPAPPAADARGEFCSRHAGSCFVASVPVAASSRPLRSDAQGRRQLMPCHPAFQSGPALMQWLGSLRVLR